MMEATLGRTIAVLERTPASLGALLLGLPEIWTMRNEGENTWTVLDVVAHLIHGERTNWIPRANWMMQFGESKQFEPFDRSGHAHLMQGKSPEQLLDEFAQARSQSLSQLHAMNLQEADLERRGMHPTFSAVTLSQLLATWAAHDVNHLHQISRIMAHQYCDAVGPWRKYLGVMHCEGHSSSA